MSNSSSTYSSSHSHSKGSGYSSKGHSSRKSDKKASSSRSKTTSVLKDDPYAYLLSDRAGIDRFVHESAFAGPWSPVGK